MSWKALITLGNTYAVRVVNKIPIFTRSVPATRNMAEKLGKVGGSRGTFVCYVHYNDKVTEGKSN